MNSYKIARFVFSYMEYFCLQKEKWTKYNLFEHNPVKELSRKLSGQWHALGEMSVACALA